MTRYLVTYAYDDARDGGAGYVGLYDSARDAVSAALAEWDRWADWPAALYWYRVDVYRYDGPCSEDYDAYEDCPALERGDDGDVLHLDSGM